MSSPDDVDMKEEETDPNIHEPFTVEENIQQLNAIDRSVVDLMNHTATALSALTIPPSSLSTNPAAATTSSSSSAAAADPNNTAKLDKPPIDTAAQKQAFREATDSFLSTLHSVDVRLKRQILALEEKGIITLSSVPKQDVQGGPAKATLKPNGVGAVGNLDVGWLNSRGSRVERDMESEIWSKARRFLEEKEQNGGSS